MDRKTLDKAVPATYAALIVISAIFVPVALAGIAIIGAVVVGAWYSFLRPLLKAREREAARAAGQDDGSEYGEYRE